MRRLAALALIAACGSGGHPLELGARRSTRSNVRAADYVGPRVCGECHGARFEQWSDNLHRAMNRLAGDPGAIVGDFSGVEVSYAGARARFDTIEGAPTMALTSASGEHRVYRVTRTIGRRYIQEYVGVPIDGEPIEVRLPYGYWLREKRWYHQQYFDSWFDEEYDGSLPTVDPAHVDPTPWATRCAWCHNTYPFEIRLGRAHSAEPRGHGPEALFELAGAPDAIGNRLPIESLVTVGISCESCHFGGREHAEGAAALFAPRASGLSPVAGAPSFSGQREDSRTINTICAQCHAAPAPLWPSGASMRNSREALDLLGSACASAIKCTDCHDPHPRGPGAGAGDDPRHLAACARCHADIAAEPSAHSRHPADVSCLDCHMPMVAQGFSSVIRSHQIRSPSAAQILAGREPDACGLCHLEMTPRQLVESLARWGLEGDGGVPAEPIDVDRPIGPTWLESGQPIVRVTAAAAYGRKKDPAAARRLLEILDDPIAYYRMRVLFAVEAVLGRDLTEYEPTASPAARRAQLEALKRTLP